MRSIHDLYEPYLSSCPPSSPPFHLILPEEFNLLPRVPSHNFFKSTFYETAIPFHRGALYSKSYLGSVICGHINMTKVPVCSPLLLLLPILSPAEAFYRIPKCQLLPIRGAYRRVVSVDGIGDKRGLATQTVANRNLFKTKCCFSQVHKIKARFIWRVLWSKVTRNNFPINVDLLDKLPKCATLSQLNANCRNVEGRYVAPLRNYRKMSNCLPFFIAHCAW